MTTAASTSQRRPTAARRLARSEHVVGWAFVTPVTVLIGIFGLLPIGWSLLLSFQKSDLLTPETPWVGFSNYQKLMHDSAFGSSVQHTVVYTAIFVPATMIVGILIAVALNRKVRGISAYRTAAYVTMATVEPSSDTVAVAFFIGAYRPARTPGDQPATECRPHWSVDDAYVLPLGPT